MIDYSNSQLKQIQEYRAVCEYVPSTGRTHILNPQIASLPQSALDLVVDHFHPDREEDVTNHHTSANQIFSDYQGLVAPDDAVDATPYPIVYEIIAGNSDPTKDPFLVQLGLTELAPFEMQTVLDRVLAKSAIETMEQGHQQTARARLKRISDQDHVTPFTKATKTETAYGFSNESLGNAKLVSQSGVGVALNGLVGVIEEMGGDPDEMIPDSMFNRPIAAKNGEPLGPMTEGKLQTLSGDQTVDVDEAVTGEDLMEIHTDTNEGLREQIKYIRDVVYLDTLHNRFTDFFETPQCPDLIWKQAALDIQNGDSPLDIETSEGDEDTTYSVEKLLKQTAPTEVESNDGSQPTEQASQTATESSQTGLSQF